MLSLTIKDTKNFMSQLLIKEAFDGLFLSEAVIKTANSYTIRGELNKDFFSEEEWNELPEKSYSRWSSIKPFCFQLIKGSKVPSYMKMVFLLPPKQVAKLLSDNQTALTPDDINGLFLNIKYQGGAVSVVTGTSIKVFSLDKTLEHSFDAFAKDFLFSNGMDFEKV